jgi:hypothetical protein
MLFALPWQVADGMAGESAKSQSGRFDPNDIDCDNLDQLTPHLRAMAERRCRNKKANFTVANKESIDNEPTPADLYKDSDKSDYMAMIRDVWKDRYPEDTILGIRFLKKEWRKEKVRGKDITGVGKKDFSVLEVAVVVSTDPEIATIFPAFLKRDNHTGEIFVGVDTKKPNYTVRQVIGHMHLRT